MTVKNATPVRILRILLAEDGITPSPGLVPEELVRLSLDVPAMPEDLEGTLGAALAVTAETLGEAPRAGTDTLEPF